MKRLTLIIIGVLLCTPLYSDMNTYIAGVGGATYEIEDAFSTDTSANYIVTDTDAASPSVGVSDGKLHWTGTGYRVGYGYHSTRLTSANHYVQGKIMIGESLNDYTALQARHDGDDTCYRVRFQGEGSGNIVLYRVIDGSATYLDLYALGAVADTEYNVRLSVSGAGDTVTVTVNIDGTDRITYSDTNAARITSGAYVGFGFKRSSDNRDVTIDDFIANAL